MKTKKLEKKLNKLIKEEYGPDGYVRIDTITIERQYQSKDSITIKGAYGRSGNNADGTVDFQFNYELSYQNGKSAEFIAGMFTQYLYSFEAEN